MTRANQSDRSKFSGQFWLVVLFEFFERGAYYGMMSFISVYFVNVLHFPKENVGVIKGVIQPLLYFLPILSGALADRFGFRRLLMIAFSLLGGGYFLTSQVTSYGAVFAALVIMGFGAGIFKPLISGSIAKLTDESNSTLGFGIYYWSINIGAFLFPLFLVPFLKAVNPTYVIIASAICTASMLIPTALFFKDPVQKEKADKRKQTNLIQTLANAFEIIYSPIVLIYHQMRGSRKARLVWGVILAALLVWAGWQYASPGKAVERFSKIGVVRGSSTLIFDIDRNMLSRSDYTVEAVATDSSWHAVTLHKPADLSDFAGRLLTEIRSWPGFEQTSRTDIENWIARSDQKIVIAFFPDPDLERNYTVQKDAEGGFSVHLDPELAGMRLERDLTQALRSYTDLIWITPDDCRDLLGSMNGRPFFMLYVVALVGIGLAIVALSARKKPKSRASGGAGIGFAAALVPGALIWLLPGIGLLGRIIASVIYISVTSLFIIDTSSKARFADHARFLLMIFLYSGFWVLYFQMFDSVLWYVQAYVDAGSLNAAVNRFLGLFGLNADWFFDVEHVTVINAGTIILLQLWVSSIVKHKKALPTMMFGILLGTLGMAILAVDTSIWVFVAGIVIFSIGEMTAHPKFISYIGLVAPQDRKAMYMGYLFLYGVFGSSIGGIVGAKLYVHFVDNLNQPRTLWLVFSGIGVFTIAALALYNKYLSPKED